MGTLRGTVEDLMISREMGRFMLRTPAGFGAAVLVLYRDTGVDAVDPTEMVRRNWMVGLLQQSLTRGMEVTVDYGPKITVQSVTLHTNITKQASTSGGKWTKRIREKDPDLWRQGSGDDLRHDDDRIGKTVGTGVA